jgi:prepilin-type N-terminal cleavage/methylation domain-containing protein/prepilin-type processing-associated H-X9-DG protein
MHALKKPGFTLIELLIVLAILSLLLALLFPVFARAREKANQVTCASNLRQIGLATMQYLQDNDETIFPRTYDDAVGGRVEWSFYITPGPNRTIDRSRGMLGSYLRNNAVWVCPSANLKLLGTSIASPYPTYGFNAALTSSRLHPARTTAQVEMPAETLFAADSARPNIIVPGVMEAPYLFAPSREEPFVCGRHSGLAEVLWFDGHVNARKPVTAYQAHDFIVVTTQQQDHLGNILRGAYTGNAQIDDYYYELVKP